MIRARIRIALALCLCICLTGCQSGIPAASSDTPQVTLPPATRVFPGTELEIDEEITLYLPNRQQTALTSQRMRVTRPVFEHAAEAAARAVLQNAVLTDENAVTLAGAYEVVLSGGVCTVNLSAMAHKLDAASQFAVARALSDTLCALSGIQAVNVLIDGAAIGLDIGNLFPLGYMTNDAPANLTEDLANRLSLRDADASSKPHTLNAVIYLPVQGGRGVLAHPEAVTAAGQTLPQYAAALLTAIGIGCDLDDLAERLTQPPLIADAEGGGRKVTLFFDDALNEQLLQKNIPRSVMLASITLTMTGLLPGVSCAEVWIGDEHIVSVTPQTLYGGAQSPILFENGLMSRADYQAFVLNMCTLYLSDGKGALVRVSRPVPCVSALDPVFLIDLLCSGTQPQDSVVSAGSAMPGISPGDMLLGMAYEAGALHIDLKAAFYESIRALPHEAAAIYAIVNTMTSIPGVSRVCLYADGAQPEDALRELYLPGAFSFAPGMIAR